MRLQTRATAAEKLVTLLRQQIRESKVSRATNSYIYKFVFNCTVAVQKIPHMQARNSRAVILENSLLLIQWSALVEPCSCADQINISSRLHSTVPYNILRRGPN